MADSSHLEKMGTELKCPICLSLLNSAVSLTCNHVFCNLCIQKSMKEASSCPVCKIPYRRREVRPAPHMDNLVSIYRSMELASGMNIFVTQTAPSAKLSGAKYQVEDVMVHRGEEDGETCRGTKNTQNKRRYENKMSGHLNNNSQDFNLHLLRPSFPTKKRIRVPQHTPPVTPTVDRKLEDGNHQRSENGAQSSFAPEGKALLSDKGEPIFTPFFWLRDEEDAERSSQHTDEENLMDTQTDAPCFSDIKDSNDANPYHESTKGEAHIQKEDLIDSEMFEWTQRACSPELCSSQMEEQVDETNGNNITKEYEDCILHDSTDGSSRVWHADTLSLKQGPDNVAVILPEETLSILVSSQIKKNNHVVATTRPKKRARKARGCIHEKRVRKDAVEVGGACTSSEKGATRDIQVKCNENGELLNLEENINRDTEQMAIKKAKSTSSVGKKVSILSDEVNTINESNAAMVFGALDLSDVKADKIKSKNVKIIGKNSEETTAQRQIYGDVTLSKSGRQTRKSGCKNYNSNPSKKSDFSKRVRFSTDDNAQSVAGIQSTHGKDVSKELQPFEKVLRNACVIGEKEPSEVKNAPVRSNSMHLQKCQAVSSIQCAFCLSTEEHNKQLSGAMVHYLKGKPVAAVHNKVSGVIHAHRNCAEWAPNVYFDDDIAINLEAELARSRRIKCSLCGLKGAALGCYEKSCRKSFHFPCAKSMQQCRWDNENFVMLCPLHASLKLPNEACRSLQKEKKNYVPKRPSQMPVSQVNKDGKSVTPQWNSHGLFSRMVLCCSALTSVEKGTISEFEKLSGVAVVKTWDPRVTHVIASTDENGACRRTLKFLMGILEGKWILSIEWVNACIKIKDHVDEQQYEIGIDIHGIRDGARLGRLRLLNKQPKLFSGYSFYFTGDFVPSYKGYLHDLVVAAGGTVLHRKPISLDCVAPSSGPINSQTLVVYSLEIPDECSPSKKNAILSHRKSDAETLAGPAGALAVSNSWILNSIAAYKLQTLTD